MTVEQYDVLIRAGGPFLLLFVAALLLRDDARQTAACLFAPLSLCLAAFLLTNSDGPALVADRIEAGLNLLAGWTVPFLWWFCLAVFDRAFRVRGLVLWVGMAWIILATANRGWLGVEIPDPIGNLSAIVFGLAIVGHLIWRLIADRRDDLIDRRRRARPLVALFLTAQLLIDLLVDLLLGVSWKRSWFALGQNVALIGFVGWVGWLSLRSDVARMFNDVRDKGSLSRTTVSDPTLAAAVRNLMDKERVFLDPDLTFASFVARTGFSERSIRHHVNHELGFDHFRTFLNARRVAEACRRLDDPATHRGEKLIAIAFDSGFASLASFNRTFLAITGRTPSAYRRQRELAANEERLASF